MNLERNILETIPETENENLFSPSSLNTIELTKETVNKKYCLFSSVGDSFDKAYQSWFVSRDKRNYDIKLVYYGDFEARFIELRNFCDDIYPKIASKYQNLVEFYDKFNLSKYDYVWVVDDDIVMKSEEINKMFEFISKKKYFLCQPSMDPKGQNSWKINQNLDKKVSEKIIHTNFVEVTCPILSHEALVETVKKLREYKNVLTAYGIDYLWQYIFNQKKKINFQILYNFMVCNPHSFEKLSKKRECLKMGSNTERWRQWNNIKTKYKISSLPHKIIKVETEVKIKPSKIDKPKSEIKLNSQIENSKIEINKKSKIKISKKSSLLFLYRKK